MNLSKKSRYGLTALIDLSIHSTKGHVSLISIAERNGISPQYLEHIFASLRRAGIIKSIKGAQGGYLLGDSPSRITVASIIVTGILGNVIAEIVFKIFRIRIIC